MRNTSLKHMFYALAAALAFPTAALAATPVAVWDGNFNAVQPGYTLNLNGNQLSADNSVITITNTYVGVDINFASDHYAGGITLIVKYEEFATGGKAKVIATQCNNSNYTTDRTGVDLQTSDQLWGMWHNNNNIWEDNGTKSSVGVFPSSGCFAFTYKRDGGTYLYAGSDTSSISSTPAFGADGLKSGTDGLWGVTVGGMRSGSINSNWRAAQEAKITAIAVFNSVLSVSEINAYKFPSEDADAHPVTSNTTVSALNALFSSETDLKLEFSPGVKLTMDTTFTATTVKIISDGNVELSASEQPSVVELAKFDVSEVQGAVKRSWLEPTVIGVNFNSDGYCQSYYYKGATNTTSAIVAGTWYANAQSPKASTNVYSDALTVISWSARNAWAERNNLWNATFIQGYLDDGDGGATVTVTGIPYENYSVIVYSSSDTQNGLLRAKLVNGDYYTWDSASSKTVKGTASWGCARVSATPVYGTNCLRIDNLSGPLSINGGTNAGADGRGGISAIQIIPNIEIDATAGYTPSNDEKEAIRAVYGTVRIIGANQNGATLDYGSTTNSFSSHIVFDGGTHTLKYSGNSSTVALGANPYAPIFEATGGAIVNFYQHDLTGWSGQQIVSTTDIRVDSGAVMNLYPYGSGTTYYRGRYTLEPGATLTSYFSQEVNGGSTLRLHGGAVQGCEQIYMPASEQGSAHAVINGDSTSNGKLHIHNDNTVGFGVFVGTNSTLDVNLAITSYDSNAPIGKWGDGTLNLNGDMSGYAGTLTVHEGKVNIPTSTTLASVVTETGATIAYSYDAMPTITSYSGDGNVVVDISSLVHGGTIESGSYVIAPTSVPAYRVSVTGLPENSGFSVVTSNDGIVLTDGFSTEWTGPSGTWSNSQFNGKTGTTDGLDVTFSQGTPPQSSVTVTVVGAKSVNSASFVAPDAAYMLTGDKITASDGLTVSGTAPVVISNELEVAGMVTLGAGSSLTLATDAFDIADGELSGSGTFVLDPGEGNTITMTKNNTSYTGEAVIKSGTVKMGSATSFGDVGHSSVIRVKGGAALDANNTTSGAYQEEKNKVVLEQGAKFCTSVAQADPKLSAFTSLSLEGDATVDASVGTVSISRHYNFEYARIATGAYTLTKIGSGDFYVSAPKITGKGRINVAAGTITICDSYYADRPGLFSEGTLEIAAGAGLRFIDYTGAKAGGGSLTVSNLVLNGTVTRQSATYSTLTVTGYITGSGTTPMLNLADGAKLKPNGKGGLKITESLTLATGTITVDISDVDFTTGKAVPLFSVGSANMLPDASAITLVGGTLPEGWVVAKTTNGLGYRLLNRNKQLRLILR